MPSGIRVKICGLKQPDHIHVAARAGARYIGLVFVEKSPRYVPLDLARDLALETPLGVGKVALTLDASDAELDRITETVPLDMLQLHGQETPERVQEVKARYGLPVMKALGVATAEDVDRIAAYEGVADQILIDAKPPKSGALPGGNGLTFDWRLVSTRRWAGPWMLAGGLTPENVHDAIALTGVQQVDASSSLESAPGEKDPVAIDRFVRSCLA